MTTIENTDYQFNYQVNRELVYYFDENRVETIYTQPGTNIKTRHYILVADLSAEKLCVKRVLSCGLYGEPKLLIVCVDSNNKIYFFWHCVITKTCKAIDFESSVVGDIAKAKMTKAPFEVDYVYRTKVPEKKMCYALVLGMQDGSSVLFLLNIDLLSNINVSFKYLNQEEGNDVGHVTSIYILPQDASDERMGHYDTQILLGYSKGAIRAFRFRATLYSYKAFRIRSPMDLSEFTEFPGYPIKNLSCARTYNSLELTVSFAQEKPNDPKFENAKAYVKLIEVNGTKKDTLKLFHPSVPSASIAEAHLTPHYEDSIDFTMIFYSFLLNTFIISVWYLDSKQAMMHMLEKEIALSSCLECLESTEQTEPDINYLLSNPEKIIEFAFPSHAVGIKRKFTSDLFKESLEALELPNKQRKISHKDSRQTEPNDHHFLRNPEKIIESAFPSQAVGLKRKATADYFKETPETLDFPNKREKLLHDSSLLEYDHGEASMFKDEENGQDYKDEKALDDRYFAEIAKREYEHLSSLVFPDCSQYGGQGDNQDDEKEISGEGTFDEETKEEMDEEAADGSVFSQDKEFIAVPRYEEEFYEQDTEDMQTSENREYSTDEVYGYVTISSDEELSDSNDDEEEYNGIEQNDSDTIPEYNEPHEATRLNEDKANEDDEDEDMRRETFENGNESEDYQEDYDEYFDAEEKYDEVEYVEEIESSEYRAEGGYSISRLYPGSSDSSETTDSSDDESSDEESTDEEQNRSVRLFVFIVDFE